MLLQILLQWRPYWKILSSVGKLRSSLARYKSRQCPPRDNVAERLHKNCVTKIELTLLNYAYIEKQQNTYHLSPTSFFCTYFSYKRSSYYVIECVSP